MSTKLKAGTATSGAVLDADATGILELQSGSTPTTAVTIDTSQNVGIGTASPAAKLDVSSSGATVASVSTTGVSPGVAFKLLGTTATYKNWAIGSSYAAVNGGLEFIPSTTNGGSTFTTPSMVLDSIGNLLVATTSNFSGAGGKLAISTDTGAYSGVSIKDTGTTYGANYQYITFVNAAGTNIAAIQHNASTTVNYATSSDARLKKDLGIATSTEVIDNIVIHNFEWKEDGRIDRGVFAQEANKIKPSAISIGTDELTESGELLKPWGVDYSKFVPDLIVYCQQLKKSLDELNAKVIALETQLGAK